jgi:predicted ATPase
MQLKIINIGKIANADITIDGITVIAGANDTGKSTVGKVLFSFFNSLYDIDNRIKRERQNLLYKILSMGVFPERQESLFAEDGFFITSSAKKIADQLWENKDLFSEDPSKLKSYLESQYTEKTKTAFKKKNSYETFLNDQIKKIEQILSISDVDIKKSILQKKLNAEFQGQINNIFKSDSVGEISLKIKDLILSATIKDNHVLKMSDTVSLLTKQIVYIDNPLVLDTIRGRPYVFRRDESHTDQLRKALEKRNTDSDVKQAFDELVNTKLLQSVLDKLDTVCNGQVIGTKDGEYQYRKNGSEKSLDFGNLSAGLKTFLILKMLIINGTVEERGVVILDEPEIHLHPEWQLQFARILVLLQKEYNLHILLNTHSPYFLNALQVYSAKEKIVDRCKYYLAENKDETQSTIRDVTDSVDEIYKTLSRPFQNLENEQYEK